MPVGEHVEHGHLPRRHYLALLHPHPRHVEYDEQHAHGEAEVVGREGYHHHVAEGEEERREQVGVERPEPYHLGERAPEEHERVEGAGRHERRRDEQGAVKPRERRQAGVEQAQRADEERQQRVALHVVEVGPRRHRDERYRVVSRYVEVVEDVALQLRGVAERREHAVHLVHKECVEGQRRHCGDRGRQCLLALYPEYAEQSSHLFPVCLSFRLFVSVNP